MPVRARGTRSWRTRTAAVVALLTAVVCVATLAAGQLGAPTPAPVRASDLDPTWWSDVRPERVRRRPPRAVPSGAAVARARRYARRMPGRVSFAVVDDGGRLHCEHCHRAYPSASLIKAMLLVADLRRVAAAGVALTPADRLLLASMVQASDNDAADVVFGRTGDAGLLAVAHDVRMRDFVPTGYWADAGLTAADQARFFAHLPRLVPRAHRAFGLGLLKTIVSWQSWGVPTVSRPRWRTLFKGGWRPQDGAFLVHQAARLQRRGHTIALALLTDGNPSHEAGVRAIAGVTRRLIGVAAAG